MTDNEIIKALECCKKPVGSGACNYCPFDYQREKRLTPSDKSCTTLMFDSALDLINRLQAENERLQGENIALNRRAIPSSGHILKVGNALLFAENQKDYDITINTIKSEAYKEFAERLKAIPSADKDVQEVFEARINNILKELVGDGDGG